jgi:hypothetical protein
MGVQDGQDTQDSQVKHISETENDRDIQARLYQDEVGQDNLDTQDSQVQQISATENDRDMQVRTEQVPHVIPFIPGIRMMSDREATEMSRHGEVLRWSSDEDGDNTDKTTLGSDTTGSTPDLFKSPEQSKGRVAGSIVTDIISDYVIQASPKAKVYPQGVVFVPETELEERAVVITEDRPVVRSLRNRQKVEMSLQQITDCQEGPKGERAIGVSIAKSFGGYEYRGIVDKIRGDTDGYIYHVEYEDGDEEELSQTELRDCYILALAPQIEAQWAAFKKTNTKKTLDENEEGSVEVQSDDEAMSDGEGSVYDKGSDEEKLNKKRKKRRKEILARGPVAGEKTTKKKKKRQKPISGLVLPIPGEKTVAAEAFGKLNTADQDLVALNINRKTKKVLIISFNFFVLACSYNSSKTFIYSSDPNNIGGARIS